ncbi:MAG TPA: RDD family protein [Tepidisphaeraceae bacterium]|nr:RDD family protein [Tepidisphaeraceae bacterium]
MSDQWYFTEKGGQAGPVPWAELREMAAAGRLGKNELVWCEGMAEWILAPTVPGLMASGPTAPMVSPNGVNLDINQPAALLKAPLPYIPQYPVADPYFNGKTRETIYAGFWLRFFAWIVDSFFLLLIMIPVLAVFVRAVGTPESTNPDTVNDSNIAGAMQQNPGAVMALRITIPLIIWLYFAFQESSRRQATLGKRLLGLIVTDENGQRISFLKATGRHFGKIVSQITLSYGYIMAGTTERKQALHDMIASCLVVMKNS